MWLEFEVEGVRVFVSYWYGYLEIEEFRGKDSSKINVWFKKFIVFMNVSFYVLGFVFYLGF